MNLDQITTRGWILALFIRSDGERFLLGSGAYDFKSELQHFQPNTLANDIVELQGSDGQLIAGQVRRSAVQPFDGYIGDSTQNRDKIENYRRAFLQFFRKDFFYTTVYIYPNGEAIQRKRGYLVDAPSVPELYQIVPTYHVALNYEDPNYYEYAEDETGQEIFANIVEIALAQAMEGGLVWDADGAVSLGFTWTAYDTASGEYINITNSTDYPAPIIDLELYGNAEQQTYEGYNLADLVPMTNGTFTLSNATSETVYDSTLGKNVIHITATNRYPTMAYALPKRLESGKYYAFVFTYKTYEVGTVSSNETYWFAPNWKSNNWDNLDIFNYGKGQTASETARTMPSSTWKTSTKRFYIDPTQLASENNSFKNILFSLGYGVGYGNITVKEAWIADAMIYEITQAEYDAGTYNGKDFEPYVGGTASPNPDYPQDIQTTTGENVVKITGKNLAENDSPDNPDANYSTSGGGTQAVQYDSAENGYYTTAHRLRIFKAEEGEQVAISMNVEARSAGTLNYTVLCYAYNSETGTTGSLLGELISKSNLTNSYQRASRTFTIPSGYDSLRAVFYNTLYWNDIQLELGSTATDYEPYQGQEYTIDLGSIELAKIGTYQDYIWKDGDEWKVHKEVGKVVLDGSEAWTKGNNANGLAYFYTIRTGKATGNDIISNIFSVIPTWTVQSNIDAINGSGGNSAINIMLSDASITSVNDFKTWLASNPTTVYYALATPTDTAITNQTLIDQLNAITSASLYTGVNNIMLTGTGAQGSLKITYGITVDTTGAGYEWEPGGTGGETTITLNAVESVRPVWSVIGPATDPTLTNITTGQTITFESTVPAGQTLIVDMDERTATMEGANVFQFINGDWLELEPGNNRLTYTASGGATDPSTLSWNGVVG